MRNPEIGQKTWAFFHVLQELEVTLSYQGIFDQEIIKSFLKMTEHKLDEDKIEDVVKKKLFFVMMEALQNICKHQKSNAAKVTNAIFLLGRTNECYHVFTGNMIENENIETVTKKIDTVNSLDKEGLKELYKSTRLNSEISEVGGAGLGFIDMSRKSGNKLIYHFEPVQDTVSFFTLLTTITIN